MATKKVTPLKTKRAPEDKAELEAKMKANAFVKKYEILRKQMISEKYSSQYFPEDSVVTLSGPVFQLILNERKVVEDFLDQLANLLGDIPKKIDEMLNTRHDLTFELMNNYKDFVDTGITKTAEKPLGTASSEDEKRKAAIFHNRYKRRTEQLAELGFAYEEKKFVKESISLEPQEVFEMEEVAFLEKISNKVSENKMSMPETVK